MSDWPRGTLPGRFWLAGLDTYQEWVFEPRDYPLLSEDLRRQLAEIEPSVTVTGQRYWPVRLSLRDGGMLDRVVLMTPFAYMAAFRCPWPELMHDGNAVAASEVVRIEESPARLPPRLVDKVVNTMSEWRMGTVVYALVMRNGSRWPVMTSRLFEPPWV